MTAGDIITISEDAGSSKKGNYFDGTDDYVLHDAHAVARVAANDTTGTYTAWIYVDNVDGTMTILSAGDNDNANEYMHLRVGTGTDGGQFKALLRHGGATQWDVRETVGSIQPKTWTHVAVVQNGTRPILYVNGAAVAMTDSTAVDLTYWYDELTGCDKFAIGVLESNNTHTQDFNGAIGNVKYYATNLTAAEVMQDYKGETVGIDSVRAAVVETARVFDITMEDDGTTDSGSGADNGILTGHAYYGGLISDWSYQINANVTGTAGEQINSLIDGNKYVSVIKRAD